MYNFKLGKIVALTAIVFIIALLFANGVRYFLRHSDPTKIYWTANRYKMALDFLRDNSSRLDQFILVIGPSEIETGFDAALANKLLQEHGINFTVINLGFRNLNNTMLERLLISLKLILNSNESPNSKFPMILLKVAPAQLTKKGELWNSASLPDAQAAIYNLDHLRMDLRDGRNIGESANILITKYFLYETSGASIVESLFFYASELFLGSKIKALPGNALLNDLWTDSKFHQEPAWNPKLYGFHNWEGESQNPLAKAHLEAIRTAQKITPNLRYHEHRTGVVSLSTSPALVERYSELVRKFKGLSDKTLLFYFPEHAYISRRPQRNGRLKKLLNEIEVKAGVPLMDIRKLSRFTFEDHLDAQHLSPPGVTKFSTILTQKIIEALSPASETKALEN